MEIEELNHVAIYVKDLERSTTFYQEVLELEALPRPTFNFPGAWFRLGKQQELHLIAPREEELLFLKNQHFALKVRSARETEEFLKRKGVAYTGPKARPDGFIQIFIQDPDGYFIEFFEAR